mmetsp:Transcript_10585/g.25870  ORF Transcript_10585/g.25870 Transcript_10585/m.25870 type:complete len:604 (-) Transcript_10585:304-2115(-)|eukprot:CAMPEP_0114505216 /NCGR_PEP_ID=MMETSP0109-20121206/10729_1 /TAXON_ID=29199 /ORGANISM="Chlorarachnion reptans, Strain CCCM449" /LENGTH=603 /DNA_ID=CAMNT_0001683629 /DNA_START=472 /DNA_END=2283 /DNA_ORIENTATION=+
MERWYAAWDQGEPAFRSEQKLWEAGLERLKDALKQVERFIQNFEAGLTERDQFYLKRARGCYRSIQACIDRRRLYAQYLKSIVSNKGRVQDYYEPIRDLGETSIGGCVLLGKCKKTGQLVAVKKSPIRNMIRSGQEFPQHESEIYRILQGDSEKEKLPVPTRFRRIHPRLKQEITQGMLAAWNRPPAQRPESFSEMNKTLIQKYGFSPPEALHVIKYHQLLFNCQEFFSIFGTHGVPPNGRASEAQGGHRHIARFMEDFSDAKYHYAVLEFCDGGDFFAHVTKKGVSNERSNATFLVQLISAVKYMHSKGLFHFDLSLEQMLLKEQQAKGERAPPDLKLIDFGMTRFGAVGKDGKRMLFKKFSCGKPGYKPPEMWYGRDIDGEKADVFCLGVCLLLMSLGYPAFKTTMHAGYQMVAKGRLPDIMRKYTGGQALAEAYTKSGLIDLITRMLQSDFEKRPTLAEILEHSWIRENCNPEILKQAQAPAACSSSDSKEAQASGNIAAASSRSNSVLKWNTERNTWKIQKPEWVEKLPKEEKSKLIHEVKSAWELSDLKTREEALVALNLTCIRRYSVSMEDATDMMWYVFLELKTRAMAEEAKATPK